jgi:hypothetical protein
MVSCGDLAIGDLGGCWRMCTCHACIADYIQVEFADPFEFQPRDFERRQLSSPPANFINPRKCSSPCIAGLN